MNQPPSVPEPTPAGARTLVAAQQPVVAVCQYARWSAAAFGLIGLPFTLFAVAIADTPAALTATAVTALMNVAFLVRAFLLGTVRAADGAVVIRSFGGPTGTP